MCPHYDTGVRRPESTGRLARTSRSSAVGLDDCTALEILDDRWRILSCRDGRVGHLIDRLGVARDLAPFDQPRPISELTSLARPPSGAA